METPTEELVEEEQAHLQLRRNCSPGETRPSCVSIIRCQEAPSAPGRRKLETTLIIALFLTAIAEQSLTSPYSSRQRREVELYDMKSSSFDLEINLSLVQFILRLLNTNVDGKQKIMYALTKIKGVGRRYSNLVCKKADVDLNKRYDKERTTRIGRED